MKEIQIPQLGQSNLEVTIEKWFVAEGETVQKGASLYELSNEKINQEIESPVTGKLTKIIKQAGEVVNPGDIIGEIED